MSKRTVAIKTLPKHCDRISRLRFLREVKALVKMPGRPSLILDLSLVRELDPETIDALVECVDQVERADAELTVVGASPEAEVILELTQLSSIMNMLPSLADTANGFQLHEADSTGVSIQPHAA